MRQCADCSLCCKLLLIDQDDFKKPINQWCQHCNPGHGCMIYQNRPTVCRAYACQWLTDPLFGPEWKPTRSRMVLKMEAHEGQPCLNVSVDCDFPDIWRRKPYYAQLKERSRHYLVRIMVGDRRVFIQPDRDVELRADETAHFENADFTGRYVVMATT